MKSKIIHIISHPPAYEEYADKPRPGINWDTPNGSWVGIWGYDWADQIANEVLKITDEFEHEVWQPDLRADGIYCHTFENGLTHRMFPAIKTFREEIIAPQMLTFLPGEYLAHNYIFHISYQHFVGLNKDLINTYKNQKFILTFHGEISLPYNALFRMQRNPLKKFYYLKQHFLAKHYFQLVDHVTYPTEKNISTLKKYFDGKLTKLTMGIDTNKFRVLNKKECRKKLKISDGTKVLLTVSRLYDLKQVDKIIEILNEINEDFIYLVIGHGTREYEQYLRKKSIKLSLKNKIRYEGYKRNSELVEYYNAADLFIHVSKSEAGPVSIMEAMACGLPIFCTDTGSTTEVLKAHDAGIVVGINDFKDWKNKLITYLQGGKIKPLDIDIVKKYYEWQNVAKKFVEIYKGI
jgi:glycosyltransferase involved in cell wall biosynthesis